MYNRFKKDEQGFLQTVAKYGWDFKYYTPSELNIATIEAPSDTVFKYTGAYGVSEPAVRLYTGSDDLALVKKNQVTQLFQLPLFYIMNSINC